MPHHGLTSQENQRNYYFNSYSIVFWDRYVTLIFIIRIISRARLIPGKLLQLIYGDPAMGLIYSRSRILEYLLYFRKLN